MFSPSSPFLAASLAFGEPAWLWALLGLPLLLALFVVAQRKSSRALARIVAPRLRTQLAAGVSLPRRRVRFTLLLLGFAALTIALARPQFGFDVQEVKRKGLDVMLAVDTSKSMLATDLEPNRLARAKLAAQDLLNHCKGDRLGVIAFAGRAFLMAPLTIDYGAVLNAVRELDTDTIPRGGTNLTEAIKLALDAFGKGEGADRALILMTDGEDLEADAIAATKKAAEQGVKIFCVGIGSPEGALLQLAPGVFVRDREGKMVRSRLDEPRLREIAGLANGIYVRLGAGPDAMDMLYRDGIGKLKAAELDAKTTMRPVERFRWPLAVAVLALVGAILLPERRHQPRGVKAPAAAVVKAALAGFILALAAPVQASPAPRQGVQQYHDGKFAEADKTFEELLREHPDSPRYQFNRGAAAYQQKDFGRAVDAFGRVLASPDNSLRGSAHYNMGNSLFRQGEGQKEPKDRIKDWSDALKHYDDALRVEPENQDAENNRAIVRQMLEEEKKKEPPPSQKGDKGDDKDKKDSDKDKKKKDQDREKQAKNDPQKKKDQKKDEQKSKDDPQDGDKPDQKDDGSPGEKGEKKDQPGDENSPPDSKDGEPDEQQAPQNQSDGQQGQNKQPRPAPETKDQSKGELQAREPQAEPKPGETGERPGVMQEAQESKDGKLTPAQARQLLDALKGEDDRVILNDRQRRQEPVYKDW